MRQTGRRSKPSAAQEACMRPSLTRWLVFPNPRRHLHGAAPPVAVAVLAAGACAPAAPSASPTAAAPQATAAAGAAAPAAANRPLVIDQPGDPATLDPGLQYDTTSYGVYRNIFDTFLGRDAKSGEIIQIGRASC